MQRKRFQTKRFSQHLDIWVILDTATGKEIDTDYRHFHYVRTLTAKLNRGGTINARGVTTVGEKR